MKKYILVIVTFYLTLQIKAQTISDVDGNTYNTVTICTQIWMKENLKTTKYQDGTAIPEVSNNTAWAALISGGYCDNNNLTSNGNNYGHLYNFYAVIDSRKLCPTGWHIPSKNDWDILENTLGVDLVAAKMKTTTSDWRSTVEATNESGFSALPGGYRDANLNYTPYFIDIGVGAFFYSSSENYIMGLHDNSSIRQGIIGPWTKQNGLSIRCLKDNVTNIETQNFFNDIFIFPNPASDKLYIKNKIIIGSYIEITDLQGKQIIKLRVDSNSIDISILSKGIYIVKIIDSKNTMINKLIKE